MIKINKKISVTNYKTIVQTKAFVAYKKNKPSLQINKKLVGVYLIVQGKKVIYVGHSSSDVKKTCYRHFQEWNDSSGGYRTNVLRLDHFVCNSYKEKHSLRLKFYFCKNVADVRTLELYFILKYKPVNNDIKYSTYFESKEEIVIFNVEVEKQLEKSGGNAPVITDPTDPDWIPF
jgi:hypothetical protein